MSPITVLIVDRDGVRRAACVRLLQAEKGIRIVGRAHSGLEDISSMLNLKPNILLIDLGLLEGKEISRLFVLRHKSPQTKVILLVRCAREIRILEALSCGVRGYIEEIVLVTFLAKAVRCVDAGEAWVPRKIVPKIIEHLARMTARGGKRKFVFWILRERTLEPRSLVPRSN